MQEASTTHVDRRVRYCLERELRHGGRLSVKAAPRFGGRGHQRPPPPTRWPMTDSRSSSGFSIGHLESALDGEREGLVHSAEVVGQDIHHT